MEHILQVITPRSDQNYLDENDSEDEDNLIKDEIEDSMDIPTTVTIVEEDGSTSVVDDASIVTGDATSASEQFGESSSSNMTYRVVGFNDSNTYQASNSGGVQVLSTPGVNVNGQYYFIGSQNVLGRTVTASPQLIDARSLGRVGLGKVRDEKKRATHNEVERRRRDKINSWINKLAKIVPHADEGSKASQSKGGILAKACEYITELRSTNIRLAAALREHEGSAEEIDLLRHEVSELRRENLMLKQQIGPTEDDNTVIISTSDD